MKHEAPGISAEGSKITRRIPCFARQRRDAASPEGVFSCTLNLQHPKGEVNPQPLTLTCSTCSDATGT